MTAGRRGNSIRALQLLLYVQSSVVVDDGQFSSVRASIALWRENQCFEPSQLHLVKPPHTIQGLLAPDGLVCYRLLCPYAHFDHNKERRERTTHDE